MLRGKNLELDLVTFVFSAETSSELEACHWKDSALTTFLQSELKPVSPEWGTTSTRSLVSNLLPNGLCLQHPDHPSQYQLTQLPASVPGRTGPDFLNNFCLSPAGLDTPCPCSARLAHPTWDRIVWQDLPPPFFTDRATLPMPTEWKVFDNFCLLLIPSAQIWRVSAYKYLLICLENYCLLQRSCFQILFCHGNRGVIKEPEFNFSASASQSFIHLTRWKSLITK